MKVTISEQNWLKIIGVTVFLVLAFGVYSLVDENPLTSSQTAGLIEVNSTVNDASYWVQPIGNMQMAADKLAEVDRAMSTLVDNLRFEFYEWGGNLLDGGLSADDPYFLALSQLSQANYNELSESRHVIDDWHEESSSALTINHGELILLCLRDPDEPDEFVDLNLLNFVAIHELAHTVTRSPEHDTEFWDVMTALLIKAQQYGLYEYEDYAAVPVDYCGTVIRFNPLG